MLSHITCMAWTHGRGRGVGTDGLAEQTLYNTTAGRFLQLYHLSSSVSGVIRISYPMYFLNIARRTWSNVAPAFCALSAFESEADSGLNKGGEDKYCPEKLARVHEYRITSTHACLCSHEPGESKGIDPGAVRRLLP